MRSKVFMCPVCFKLGTLTREKRKEKNHPRTTLRELLVKFRKQYPSLPDDEIRRLHSLDFGPFDNKPHIPYGTKSDTRRRNTIFKIVHNIKQPDGTWIPKKCYLGVYSTAFKKIEEASKKRDDLIPSKLIKRIKELLVTSGDGELKDIPNNETKEANQLIADVITLKDSLYWKLMNFNTQELKNKHQCPICKKHLSLGLNDKHELELNPYVEKKGNLEYRTKKRRRSRHKR